MRRQLATSVCTALVVGVMALAAASAEAATAGVIPWTSGTVLTSGWSITSLKRHPEFVRLELVQGDERAQVEVIPARAEDSWSTAHYRVQPPPGAAAHPEALRAVLASLRAWEEAPDHRPFVATVIAADQAQKTVAAPSGVGADLPQLRVQHAGSWPPDGRWWWLLADALLLALLAACLSRSATPRSGLWGLAAAMAAGALTWLVLDPTDIPTDWITILQEGSVASIVASLHGQGHHGPALDALRWLLGSGESLAVRDIVHINLALAVTQLIAVGVWVWTLSGRASLGVLTAAAWGLSPLQVNAAFSDLPAVLLAHYTLAAAVAVGLLGRAPRLSLATLALAAVLAGGVRLEWGVLGALAWGSAVLAMLVPEGWRTRLDRGWVAGVVIALGAGVISLVGEASAAGGPQAWTLWQRNAGGVVGAGVFTWPLGLAGGWPIGLVGLAIVGALVTLRRPLTWTVGGCAALLLHGVYWTSAHDGDAPYEVLRYATLMSGLAVVWAALGWREVLRWCEGRRWGQASWMVLAGLCLLPVPDGVWRSGLEAHHAESVGPLYDMPLTRHQQAEARSLMAAIEAHPECLIATVSAVEPAGNREVTAYEYVFFGGSLMSPQVSDRAPGVFGDLVDSVAASGECVLFHRGLDCHIAQGPDCREEVAGARFVSGFERVPRPYYDHVWRHEPVRLEVWARQGKGRRAPAATSPTQGESPRD